MLGSTMEAGITLSFCVTLQPFPAVEWIISKPDSTKPAGKGGSCVCSCALSPPRCPTQAFFWLELDPQRLLAVLVIAAAIRMQHAIGRTAMRPHEQQHILARTRMHIVHERLSADHRLPVDLNNYVSRSESRIVLRAPGPNICNHGTIHL